MLLSVRSSLRLAVRLARGHWGTLAVLIGCIALAVTAIAGVDGFLGGLKQALAKESRPLLQADLSIRTTQPLTPIQRRDLASILPADAETQVITQLVTMAIAKTSQRTRLVEVKAVEAGYPFYGRVKTHHGTLSQLLTADNTALVQPELLAILRINVGDTIQLGKANVTVIGVLASDGGAARPIALGPTVLITRQTLAGANLTGVGARVAYATLVKLPKDDPDQLAERLRRKWNLPAPNDSRSAFGQPVGIEIRSLSDAQRQVEQLTDRFGRFLAVASLSGVILSTIALLYLIQAMLLRSLSEIGTFRAVGLGYRAIGVAYTWVLVSCTFLGVALGYGLSIATVAILGKLLSKLFDTTIFFYSPLWDVMGTVALMGLTCMFAVLWVFLSYASTKPIQMIRGDATAQIRWVGWHGALVLFGLLIVLGVSIIRSNSIVFGPAFVGVIGVGAAAIFGIGRLLIVPFLGGLKQRFTRFPVSLSLAYIFRNPTRLVTILSTLSLTAMMVTIVLVVQSSLGYTYRAVSMDTPSLFLVDATPDQLPVIRATVRKMGGEMAPAPIVRAKISAINGKTVTSQQDRSGFTEGQDRRAFLNREQNLSFRSQLAKNEAVSEGTWLSRPDDISLEQSFAKRIGVEIGDTLTFDIQGTPVTGTVRSIRSVKWNAFSPTFFILLHPDLLAGAPASYVASVSGIHGDAMQSLQIILAESFPNITFVDIRVTVEQVLGVVKKLSLAIAGVAGFSFAIGLLVMMSIAISAGRERLGEFAVLKAIGASIRQLKVMIITEFLLIGIAVTGIGIGMGVVAAWVILTWVFPIQISVPIWPLLGVASGLVGAIVGVAGILLRQVQTASAQQLFDR